MAPADLHVLDSDALEDFYDPGSLERGRAYAREGRVRVLTVNPGTIKSVCTGSGRSSYVITVKWRTDHGTTFLDDTCSCPLGGACKHCVATIVTARERAGITGSRFDRTPPTPRAKGADWRRALVDLGPSAGADETAPGLALQFGLSAPPKNRFAHRTESTISLRPMRMGRSGRWVKSGAGWRDIASPYGYDLSDVDEAHLAAVRALMASGRIGQYYNLPTVTLAQFGADLWHHLTRAVEVGVSLIGESPLRGVSLAPTAARPVVDLTAADDGTVTLTGALSLGDQPLTLPDDTSGLLGSPPHGLWRVEDHRLELISLDRTLHPSVARLVHAEPLVVPPEEVDELLDVYHPALARHATVTSSDRSVTITEPAFEALVLTVERTSLSSARLLWSVRYRRGERHSDHALAAVGGPHRDRAAERVALDALSLPVHLLGQLADPEGRPRDVTVSGPDLITLVAEVLPLLEEEGTVLVEHRGDQPELRSAEGDPLISLTVTDGAAQRDGNDWFDLDVSVSIDGQAVDFPSLFTALSRGDEVLILPSGTWIMLDRPEFARLRELIEEARELAEPDGSAVARVNRFQSEWWEELAGLGVVEKQSQRWMDSVAQMASLSAPEPVGAPAGLAATLRPYQQEGLDWLAFLHANRLGGILADDMGLGKTVQTLALCLHVTRSNPEARFLVVAPTSVVDNWVREATRFAPDLAVVAITETAKRRGTDLGEAIAGASIVVTSYALFRLEFEAYAAQEWEVLLLDEAQFVKNHQGKTYGLVRRLDVSTKIAMTGTPLENTLMDLWSLLSITAPGLYPDPKRFDGAFRKPIESGDAPERLATLRRRMAPLMRRRTKDQVLTELPPKTEQVVEVEMSARHARIYQTQLQRQRQKVLGLVGDVNKHRFEILKSLTVLRQLALDPGLVDEDHDHVGSAKLDRLVEDLTQVVAEGHRALVFSQFTRFLGRLRDRLDAAGMDHAYLDGRTRKRDQAIARFKDGDAPVFVISLKAGGFGLNLTEADYCFILDPWWNPATETQAVDRTHRMGQVNPVMVYRYVSTGTIEEKVMELKARKADLFSSVMDADGSLTGALSEDDIRGLLDLG